MSERSALGLAARGKERSTLRPTIRALRSRPPFPLLLLLPLLASCALRPAPSAPDPLRYRLTGSGSHWDVAGSDPVLEDLLPRYPEFFAVILDPSTTEDPHVRALRDDLERKPTDRRNYDALNALAIGYFELNYRAQLRRGEASYFGNSFRAAKLLAIPWRAYGELEDGAVRDAILDFLDDATRGEKLETGATAGRLARIVASLEGKESDGARLRRIRSLVRRIEESYETGP